MDITPTAAPVERPELMPQPGNRPPSACPGEHRSPSACPWCRFDPLFQFVPVRSVRVHLTLGRDRDLAYCGVRGEQTTMVDEITCAACNTRADEIFEATGI